MPEPIRSNEPKPYVGQIVMVRDRRRPPGSQVFPGIIYNVRDSGQVDITTLIAGAGDAPEIPKIDGTKDDEHYGWYSAHKP